MLATPDYGLSDIWHFNYPLKHLLDVSLKQGQLPLWTDMVGNGFPIAAEGQIGAFSPLNWIVFGVLPMPQAFITALLLTFVLTFTGSYLWMRKIGLSKVLSAASALFASFNGYFIVQMTHLSLLQSFSFIPWALFCTEKLICEKNHQAVLWLGFVLAQMILVGYPQTFINSLLILTVYSTIRNWDKKISSLVKIMAGAVIAVLLSAIQIIPLSELVKQSDTLSAAAGQRYIHPLPIKHLLSVFYPFMFGDPSKGTYLYYGRGSSIFWENLLYVGISPIGALLVGSIVWLKQKKLKFNSVTSFALNKLAKLTNLCSEPIGSEPLGRRLVAVLRPPQSRRFVGEAGDSLPAIATLRRWQAGERANFVNKPTRAKLVIVWKAILAVFLASTLLALGKTTPVGLLFKLLPLSFTRIESRFLAFSNISLGLLGGVCLFWLLSKMSKHVQAVIITTVALFHIAQVSLVFRQYHLWGNDTAWLNKPDITVMLPNNARVVSIGQELLWKNFDATSGWENKETQIRSVSGLMGPNSNLIFGIKQLGVYAQQYPKRYNTFRHHIYGSDLLGNNLRNMFGVTHILDASSGRIKIRENLTALPNIWSSNKIYRVRNIDEALGRMNQPDFTSDEVLWENDQMPNSNEKIVVINRSWYPGWKAFIDDQETTIYPVNINQQAIIALSSTPLSKIILKYDPLSYKIGAAISLMTFLVWFYLVTFKKTKKS